MNNIRVHFDNGDSITTRINGEVSDIVRYYLDNVFTFETENGNETTAKARCIEFLDQPGRYMAGRVERLHRVYSISEDVKERYNLYSTFRFTAFYPCFYGDEKTDAAYLFGMFDKH